MKIIFPIRACPTHKWKFQKYSNKIRKSNKYPYGFISRQNRLEKAAKEWKEKLSFHFVHTRSVIENSKKMAKKLKKILLWLLFNPKYVGEGQEREEMKIIVPIRSYPTNNWKFQKNSNKIRKSNKYPYGFILSQNRLKKAEKERK